MQSLRCKYYDHYGAIYYLFLDHLRQHHTIPIQDIKKSRHFEIIQQRQRNNSKKQAHTPVFQHSSLNNSGFDTNIGGYKRIPGESRHSYIQESTKDISALQDISLNSSPLFQTSPCSALDAIGENRHKSPACYVHVINQQTIINNIAPLLNFSTYSKEPLPMLMNSNLPTYQSSNISNSSHSPQSSLNANDFISPYQEPQMPHLSTSPSSLSAHSIKMSSPTTLSYNSSYNTSPNYALVNSQFSSIINEMENLNESDTGFNGSSYESPSSMQFKYSESDSLYSPRFSYPESNVGITAQYSNSTDEGVEADMDENYPSQRLSYGSSSSSSGVGAPNNCFGQNESCSSFHALTNQSSFESYKDKIKDVTSSLPSCTGTSNCITLTKTKKRKTPSVCPSSWRRYSPLIQSQQPPLYQFFRSGMKSPSDFREGRRASDGFVTQHEQKGKNAETSSLKESTSKDAIFSPEYCNLTEKAKGFLELHDLPKEHYDLKSLYDTIMAHDDDLSQRSTYAHKSLYENKIKYPAPRSPTYSMRQSPYYESYKYDSAADKDNVFLEANSSLPCKSPTKLHQKWQNAQKQGAYSQIMQNSLPHAEISPSRSRRKLFRQLKHKPATVPLESYTEDIPTIVEDSSNGYKNEDYLSVHRDLPSTSTLSQNDTNQHITTWNSSVPESDLFQF